MACFYEDHFHRFQIKIESVEWNESAEKEERCVIIKQTQCINDATFFFFFFFRQCLRVNLIKIVWSVAQKHTHTQSLRTLN